jgi:hypothetical protein
MNDRPTPILRNTTWLADRWGVCTRTVLRICRYHGLTEIRLRPGGRVFFRLADIEGLEARHRVTRL